MSLEAEKAKLYKELVEISEKLTPLRNEYNFITTDIPEKTKEYDKLIKDIWQLRVNIQIEKELLAQYKEEEKAKIDSNIMALSSKKKQYIEQLNNSIKELQDNIILLENTLQKEEKELAVIRKEYEDKTVWLWNIKLQEIQAKNNLDEYIKKHNQLIIEDKERTDILDKKEKEISNKEKQVTNNEKKYLKIKWEAEEKVNIMESMMFDLTKREEDVRKKEADIERREIKLKEDKEDIEKTHIESKEIMQTITEKELQINKTISDFQDEKYKFLVLMKQKEIKRTDIDKLDKEFNL